MRLGALLLLGGSLLGGLAAPLAAPPGAAQGEAPPGAPGVPVLQLDVEGPITRATALYVEEGLRLAEEEGVPAVLLVLNTPGGGLAETFAITDMISGSAVPVLGFVAPSTARAWSAGTMILLSTHLAAMAPFTAIGSAQPVALGEGGFTPINDSKIINALVEQMRNLAAAHGRNMTAAEEFVTRNLNLNASEALEARVVEVVAPDVAGLLAAADGREVRTGAGNATLGTAGRAVRVLAPSLRVAVFDVFVNPIVAGLLMLIGIYALTFGLGAPGHGAEVAGVIAILLGLVGLGFNVNLIALALVGLGAALLLLELYTPGFGAMGLAGLVALVLGSVFLLPLAPSGPAEGFSFPAEYQQYVLGVLALPSVLFAGFLVFALLKVQKARAQRPVIGGVEGEEAEVVASIAPGSPGFVRWRGEEWQAVSASTLEPGERVVIRGKEGPVLRVEPRGPRPPPQPPGSAAG